MKKDYSKVCKHCGGRPIRVRKGKKGKKDRCMTCQKEQ